MNLKKDGYILFKNCIDTHIMQSMYYTEMKVLIDLSPIQSPIPL
jgi:hypothetical protein